MPLGAMVRAQSGSKLCIIEAHKDFIRSRETGPEGAK